MDKIEFKVNNSKIKIRNEFFYNKSLNSLVEGLLLNKSWNIFIKDIVEFFNSSSFEHYHIKVESKIRLYKFNFSVDEFKDFEHIISYFNSFESIWDDGKMRKLKGTFLELFSFKFLELKYSGCRIYRESRLFSGSFISSLLIDVVGELDNNFKVFECKFSRYGFKRSYLDNLYAISKVCPFCEVFILTLEFYDDFYNFLYSLKSNTSNTKFDNLINSIDILSFECFEEGYFLV